MAFPVDEALIAAAEAQLQRGLPAELRERLRHENGGEIAAGGDMWSLYPVRDQGDRRRLKRTANHIVRETAAARSALGFPPESVAIAENGTGDYLILRPRRDTIEWWHHETGGMESVEVTWYPEDLDHELADHDEDGSHEGVVQGIDLHRTHEQMAMDRLLSSDVYARYRYFLETVARNRQTWSLKGSDGWVLAADAVGQPCAPFWPEARFARLCAAAEWEGTEPAAVGLDEFLDRWLPGMRRDHRGVAVFPTPSDAGFITNPARVGEDLARQIGFHSHVEDE